MNRRPVEDAIGSPKKQPRVVLSPESMSRKRTRLEDQLSDIQYIDCNTPESATISTTAVIHTLPEPQKTSESYQPKNKSPRNSSSESENKRQSLNLEPVVKVATLPKSMTDTKLLVLNTPQSPIYQPLVADSSATSTPDFSAYENVVVAPKSPTYENVLTTISITYKSVNNNSDSIYEDVVNPERAVIPTSDATLPVQEASQPDESETKSAVSLISLSPQEETTDLTLSEVVHQSSPDLSKISLDTPSSTLSPNVSESELELANGDKRKSCESEAIYQQVKYFRRSIHEINSLIELEKPEEKSDADETAPDSLEISPQPCVKDLKSVFEEKPAKVYDGSRDSLPPCVRARNLKHQPKTRSLDETEFQKECGADAQQQRRKSLDETVTAKLNAPPKALNQPKELPADDGKLDTLHLAHATIPVEQLRRDRIEKYKEARRKFLQDKYRSESFKEDKDVLLSRLKVFRKNCDESEEVQTRLEDLTLKVRRWRRNRDEETASDSLEDDSGKPKTPEIKPEVEEDFLRRNSEVARSERRRHTFDSRERETELDRIRRISLETRSPR